MGMFPRANDDQIIAVTRNASIASYASVTKR